MQPFFHMLEPRGRFKPAGCGKAVHYLAQGRGEINPPAIDQPL
ncbi:MULTISPECIES: hypothetical protein [unclassified Prochlorococcus]|nr:hypothetical protein [Prochlorococcus sp. MIT 0701]KGG27804.1 hypothetical protein EV12_1067 [Prochlorococcus sp. MIT 0701]KGG29562.1 hypothetical protein EV13_1029 [Prochlorococcus sp. MIT 0702]KGG36057.1 hypothetical protein EV14_0464 [Prochlorococcus sp. MIT 0703]